MKKLILFVAVALISGSLFSQPLVGKRTTTAASTKKLLPAQRVEMVEVDFDSAQPGITKSSQASTAIPEALYSIPDGYFYVGMSYDNAQFSEYFPLVIGPAYHGSANWKNLSTGATQYLWQFNNPEVGINITEETENAWILTDEENPNFVYPAGDFLAPKLIAVNDEGEGSFYIWGYDEYSESGGLLLCGGQAASYLGTGLREYGATNLDHFYCGITTSRFGTNNYVFGTNSQGILAVAEYFAKPTHPYVLDQVRFALSRLSAPANHEFEIIIHRMKDKVMLDTIASSVCRIEEAYIDDVEVIYTLFFSQFKVRLPNGSIVYTPDLTIEDEILVELTNVNASGVMMGVIDQDTESFDGKSTAYFFRINNSGVRELYPSEVATLGGKPLKTSLGVMLDITYSYMVPNDTIFQASREGGSKTFEILSYYSNEGVDEEGYTYDYLEFENLPDWLSTQASFTDSTSTMSIEFTAQALPAGSEERSVLVRASTPGSFVDFTIQQGDFTAIDDIDTDSDAFVRTYVGGFELNYSSNYHIATIYSVQGQKVSEHLLPDSGQALIPMQGMAKGCYLIRFAGEKTQIIKAILH